MYSSDFKICSSYTSILMQSQLRIRYFFGLQEPISASQRHREIAFAVSEVSADKILSACRQNKKQHQHYQR